MHTETKHLDAVLEAIGDALLLTDLTGRMTQQNTSSRLLWGVETAALLGRPVADTLGTDQGLPVGLLKDLVHRCLSLATRQAYEPQPGERPGSNAAGCVLLVEAEPLLDARGKLLGALLRTRDYTSEQALDAALTYHTRCDVLTGLPNRDAFEHTLLAAVKDSIHSGEPHVLCHLDLDHFKLIVETQGREIGDALLGQLAQTLRSFLRRGDTLARLGGDEFGVLLRGCDEEQGTHLAQGLLVAVDDFTFTSQGEVLRVGASVGLILIDPTASPAELLLRADAACQLAKEQGRQQICLSRKDDIRLTRRFDQMHIANVLRRALPEDRLCLYAEPVVSAADPSLVLHQELLVRLIDTDQSLRLPVDFIPAAERYHLMPPVDRWVVSQALAHLRADGGRVAINLSGQSLNDPRFAEFVECKLRQYGTNPAQLCFEITETQAVNNLAEAAAFMRRLQRLGVSFALDDFGSGMSSFAYLRELPVQWLKIDGVFLREPDIGAVDRALIAAMTRIGAELGMQVVAEHVAHPQQVALLRNLGVNALQGYAVGRAQRWLDLFSQNRNAA